MWIQRELADAVDQCAIVFYIDQSMTAGWNENRRANEPRLMTGWCWESRNGGGHRTGIKTITAAYIDAWYALVQHQKPPRLKRAQLRLVRSTHRAAA
jgi:hypothetical protein